MSYRCLAKPPEKCYLRDSTAVPLDTSQSAKRPEPLIQVHLYNYRSIRLGYSCTVVLYRRKFESNRITKFSHHY